MAVLGLGNCIEELPTRQEIETSINRTIEEVERMIREDHNLPRLSRNEIVNILFNITSTDMNSYKDHIEKARQDYQRALMVVLPYNAKDAKDEKELYTKAPVVKLLSDIKNESFGASVKALDNLINTDTKLSQNPDDESEKQHKNHRDTFMEISAEPSTVGTAPEKFSFNLENFKSTKEPNLVTKNNLRNKGTIHSKSGLEIVYSTSVTQRPTTKILKTTKSSEEVFRPTMPPTRSSQNVLTSDQWHYNAPPSTSTSKTTRIPFLPTMMSETVEKVTSTLQPEVPTSARTVERFKVQDSPWSMEKLRILDENEKSAPLYVTPMTANTPEVTKATTPMREQVQDLLASIGLHPMNNKTKPKPNLNAMSNDPDTIFGENFQIPESTNVIVGQTSGLTSVGIDAPSIRNQNTFENTPYDVKKGYGNLSPDVQLLFQRFGLQTSGSDRESFQLKTTTEKPRRVTSKTSVWNNFKPLPTSEVRDEGMKNFLAKFGLGFTNARNEKSMKSRKNSDVTTRKPSSLIDAVPGNMQKILENIGLITKSQQRPVEKVETIVASTEAPKLHVFKPHEASLDDEKQRTKINELLDTVKLVQEGKADVDAVQQAAKELLESTKSLQNGPDPLSLEEILKMYNDDVKNEIKRQQDPKDLAEMATSGIKRLMIYVLGSSELWVGRIIGGLTRIRNVLNNVTNKIRLSGGISSPVLNPS